MRLYHSAFASKVRDLKSGRPARLHLQFQGDLRQCQRAVVGYGQRQVNHSLFSHYALSVVKICVRHLFAPEHLVDEPGNGSLLAGKPFGSSTGADTFNRTIAYSVSGGRHSMTVAYYSALVE